MPHLFRPLTTLLLACSFLFPGGSIYARTTDPLDSLKLQLENYHKQRRIIYNGADFSLSAGYRFIFDDYFQLRNRALSERYNQAHQEMPGITVSMQLEIPLNRSFRAGVGLNYGQHRRQFSPEIIGLAGPAIVNTQHLLQVPVYLAADHAFRGFSIGASAGGQFAVFSGAKGQTLDSNGETINYSDTDSTPFYNNQPRFYLLLGLRSSIHLRKNLNLIARIDYRNGNGNELGRDVQSASLTTSSLDFRLGFNYAIVCFD